jgi:hypothetical protein
LKPLFRKEKEKEMASTKKIALLLLALTLLICVGIIGISFIQPASDDGNGTDQTRAFDPSLSNGTSLTVMDGEGPDFNLPEYGIGGSLIAIIAGIAAVFVIYQRKK